MTAPPITSYICKINDRIQLTVRGAQGIDCGGVGYHITPFQLLFKNIFGGDYFFVLYSSLLHLTPLRFHCTDGCWDRTQDVATGALAAY